MKIITAILLALIPSCVFGNIISIPVAGNVSTRSVGVDEEFHFASIDVDLTLSNIHWIAWNNRDSLIRYSNGNKVLGNKGYGVDDYIQLTVINPSLDSLTVDIDMNDRMANSTGNQAVILGESTTSPDVWRSNFDKQNFLFDESGSHNSIFTTDGIYTFDFSFRNKTGFVAGNTNSFLLIDSGVRTILTPEPNSLLLALLGLVGIFTFRNR